MKTYDTIVVEHYSTRNDSCVISDLLLSVKLGECCYFHSYLFISFLINTGSVASSFIKSALNSQVMLIFDYFFFK